ncbi:hypothetical protein [Microbacterium stercoris]|uniref:Uncharacterized protein n=1 Tax=Microbacterium stercoris TaxID=2820289 RepID=A0A939QSJ8_9MICO|nr:hypothetical protein [Microbacterium stercoris]MBO3664791.1 hypothetical protein [Microbacterium stercoris]
MTTAAPDLNAALRTAEAARMALASELEATRRELWRARTELRLPHLAPVLDMIQGKTEDEFGAYADELDAALKKARGA